MRSIRTNYVSRSNYRAILEPDFDSAIASSNRNRFMFPLDVDTQAAELVGQDAFRLVLREQ